MSTSAPSACSENNSNPRQMWSVINQVTGRSRQHQEPACPMDAVTTAFHKVITDTSRPQSLQIPSGPPPQQCLISFPLVTVREVERLLRSINTTKATGSDDIPGFVLKHSADILPPSLVTLLKGALRLHFRRRVFDAKTKVGEREDLSNKNESPEAIESSRKATFEFRRASADDVMRD